MSTIGPVAVGVVLAFAWNMTVSRPLAATRSDSGVTPEVGLTVEQAAAQAWASATPRTATAETAMAGTTAAGTAATRTTAGTAAVGSPGTPGSGTWWRVTRAALGR